MRRFLVLIFSAATLLFLMGGCDAVKKKVRENVWELRAPIPNAPVWIRQKDGGQLPALRNLKAGYLIVPGLQDWFIGEDK